MEEKCAYVNIDTPSAVLTVYCTVPRVRYGTLLTEENTQYMSLSYARTRTHTVYREAATKKKCNEKPSLVC